MIQTDNTGRIRMTGGERMLNIVERNDEELEIIQHGENVFHEALELVMDGEERIHVTDKNGKVPDYDLVYTENMLLFPEVVRAKIMQMTGGKVLGDYLTYDEENEDMLCLDFIKQFKKIELEVVDEYSIVLSRMALKHSDATIYYTDGRFTWFIEGSDRVVKVDDLPDEKDQDTLRVTGSAFEFGFSTRDFTKLGSVPAFQNIFFWQAFAVGKKGPFKYVEVVLNSVTGIGGILSNMSTLGKASKNKGFEAYLRPNCTRYPEDLLCRYFKINTKPEDATEDNTLVLNDMPIIHTTWYCCHFPSSFDESIFDETFAEQMKRYTDAVLRGKKTLGVLARGTDYVTADLGGDRIHATAEQMITVIQKWVEEDGYEKIFLATEDQDIFKKIREAFPKKVIAVIQRRTSVKELKKKGATLLSELEKKSRQGQAYRDALEDTTVNYFYALYILSKCDAFLCSGQCNGWDTVRSLNHDGFKRERKLFVNHEGDPAIEDWKTIRPITAGMFARGTYPTSKPLYMTYRFDLNEEVEPDAIKEAWDKTLSVYPYVGYAVGIRKGQLVLLENDLPFVITETSEVIEPYGRAGNFHTVTFCYLDKVLCMYVDHIPFDGTGFKAVLETFFYHYYCILDKCEYKAPDGVNIEGVAQGQDVDAYRMVDAIDPSVMKKNGVNGDAYVLDEEKKDEMFPSSEDIRGYCISAPSDEFMSYAKSVKASPMSLLSVLYAKTVNRIHPENKKPIKTLLPISVRNVMGNENSLLHQVVHVPNIINIEDLDKGDEELNMGQREFLKGVSSEQNIKMMCGIYHGICEGFTKAYAAGALDGIIIEQHSGMSNTGFLSYLGTLRGDEYTNRIRMSAFHGMPGNGIMLQLAEVGNHFYIDWYQGFHGDMYAKAMRDIMREAGIKGVRLERVE